MSEREQAIHLLNIIPDYKMGYVVAYLQGVTVGEDIPNQATLSAYEEGDEMIANGTGQRYTNLDALWHDLEE